MNRITTLIRRSLEIACRLVLLLVIGSATVYAAPSTGGETIVRHRLFVTNEVSNDLSVVDGLALKRIATVKLGKRPRGIQASPDGKTLFIALSGSPLAPMGQDDSNLPADKSADGIGVVDVATLKLLRVIRGVSDPEQLAVSPDGLLLYVASEDTGFGVVLDVARSEKVASIKVGEDPEGVGVTSKGGRRAWFTSEGDHVISVVDAVNSRLIKNVQVGKRPRSIAFSPDESRAYAPGESDSTVSVIDTKTLNVLDTIHLDGDTKPMDAVMSHDGLTLYLTTGRGHTLIAIDTQSRKVARSITVGQRPWGVAISPDGKRLYTANGPSDDVSVVDAESFKVIATVPVGKKPWGIAIAR